MNFTPADLAFILDALDRRGRFSAARTADGKRAVVEATLGYHDAVRLAALIGGTEPAKNGTRWRTRLRGARAEALLGELLPHFPERSAAIARRVVAEVEEARAARLARIAAAGASAPA